MFSDQQTYMNSCEFDIMHNIVFAGVGQLLNLGEGPRSNLSYHVSNFKATTLPYFFRIPHLKGIGHGATSPSEAMALCKEEEARLE